MKEKHASPTPMPGKPTKEQRQRSNELKRFSRLHGDFYASLRELEGIVSMMDRLMEHGEAILPEEAYSLVMCHARANKTAYKFMDVAEEIT